jgi:hypothetical protein
LTLVLLDTNAYLRLAKRVRPLLGVPFGNKRYVLTVLKDVEEEVRRSRTLQFKFPWFEEQAFGVERDAARIRLSAVENVGLDNLCSVLRGHVLAEVDRYTRDGRRPPSETDCRVLAFGEVRTAIVVTDDLGMHLLARDFEIVVWHGWELLARMRAAKKVDGALIRDIYDALERNGDLTATWAAAKHTEFEKVFGPKR